MKTSALFTPDHETLAAFLDEHPLGLLVSHHEGRSLCTPLPLMVIGRSGEDGLPTFLGHFARGNPHALAAAAGAPTMVVFLGPHAYVSPSRLRDRTQAPTWNYAIVECQLRLRMLDADAEALPTVDALTRAMEAGHDAPWAVHELGERLPRLLGAVVPFVADTTALRAKFKLGQNERIDVLHDILRDAPPGTPYGHWLRRLNAQRLVESPEPPR